MQIPLQITFRHMVTSVAADEAIREHVDYLEQFFDNVTGCRVVIDAPPAHRTKGGPFSVHLDLTVPGREIFVSTERDHRETHSDLYIALRDAFDAAKRQLDGHAQRQRGELKNHSSPRAEL